MNSNKKMVNILLAMAILVTASIAYYFLFSLPRFNAEKLDLQKEKQQEDIRIARDEADAKKQKQQAEDSARMLELAKDIQDACIENIQNSVVSYFDKTNTTYSPLFYPYEDEGSFNRNERLLTALDAYQSCITNDPRYDYDNSAIKSILIDAGIAQTDINNYLVRYRDKTEGLCDSYLLSESAKGKCQDMEIMEYDFGF